MAKKMRREDLRRDEVMETVGKGIQFVSAHRRGATEAIGIAVALAVLIGAFVAFRAHRENQAGDHLSRALAVLATPLVSDPAAGTVPKTYPSPQERDADADRELAAAAEFGATRSGREAEVILAARGRQKDSLATFDRFARSGKTVVSAAAEIDRYRALAAQGKTAEAIAGIKRAIETSASPAPKDALLSELAALYEQSGSPADAKATYQRLASEYPESPYTQEAQSKIGSAS
jgi:tetratricopeptide (TPR) repeat protein